MESLTYGIPYERIVDGGYLSYVLGIREDMRFWQDLKWRFRSALICMDSNSYHRRALYPKYKSRRAEQRLTDNRKAINYLKVEKFRKLIIEDLALEICKVDGAEGDDLIALAFMLDPTLDVVAVDKDLHSVPGLYQAMLRGSAKDIKPLSQKVPQYIGERLRKTPASLLILQALRGDKSDSIPRLLPSGITEAKRMWARLYGKRDRISFANCYTELGADFIRNLNLVLMPGPFLLDNPDLEPDTLFEMICDRTYWSPEHFSNSISLMLESRNPDWRVRDLWQEELETTPSGTSLAELLEAEEGMPVLFDANDAYGYWTP